MRSRCLLWLPVVLGAVLPAQTSLSELPMLARARGERQRPAQEKALEPFWPDLRIEYKGSEKFLDARIEKVAELGDAVVPLLLEKLAPTDSSGANRHLADNCRRVLARLDPASFLDALVELARGEHDLGRAQAIRLLGHANSPRAVEVLDELLTQCRPHERRLVLGSLTALAHPGPAARAAGLLGSDDREVREAVLLYLTTAKAAAVTDVVLQALSVEKEARLLLAYIEYFAATTRGNDTVARALLPLLERDRLDWADTERLMKVLGSVAPKDHDLTCKRLHEMLDPGETSTLALQAALTLRDLGDKSGIQKLQKALTEQIKKPQRKREANLYELRGNLFFAIDELEKAIADYESVVEYSEGAALRRRAHMQLARCEARRHKWVNVLKNFKEAAPALGEVQELAKEDPDVAEALQQDKIKAWLAALPK